MSGTVTLASIINTPMESIFVDSVLFHDYLKNNVFGFNINDIVKNISFNFSKYHFTCSDKNDNNQQYVNFDKNHIFSGKLQLENGNVIKHNKTKYIFPVDYNPLRGKINLPDIHYFNGVQKVYHEANNFRVTFWKNAFKIEELDPKYMLKIPLKNGRFIRVQGNKISSTNVSFVNNGNDILQEIFHLKLSSF